MIEHLPSYITWIFPAGIHVAVVIGFATSIAMYFGRLLGRGNVITNAPMLVSLLTVPALSLLGLGYMDKHDPINFEGVLYRALKNRDSIGQAFSHIISSVAFSMFAFPFIYLACAYGLYLMLSRKALFDQTPPIASYGILFACWGLTHLWVRGID